MAERMNPPLRHGWGGDTKRRDRVLKERREEELERIEVPEKFTDSPPPLDMMLLEAMQQSSE